MQSIGLFFKKTDVTKIVGQKICKNSVILTFCTRVFGVFDLVKMTLSEKVIKKTPN
jgi:hypothetical protein